MKKVIGLMVAMLAAATAMNARAQAYVGGGFGLSQSSVACAGATGCDKKDVGFKLFGGYKFTPNVGVEGGLLQFGTQRFDGRVGTTPYSVDVKPRGAYAAAVLSADLAPELSAVTRLGISATKTTAAASLSSIGSLDAEERTSPFVGVGLAYKFSPNLSVGVDADFTRVKYGSRSARASLFTLSSTYTF